MKLAVREDNPLCTFTYEVPPSVRAKLDARFNDIVDAQRKNAYGPPIELIWQWRNERHLEVIAPEAAQRVLVADTEAGSVLPGVKLVSKEFSTRAKPPAAFPSLEDQKIADRAYKLLGIDFEPINADELARIKELGYDGGLRIAGLSQMQAQFVGLSEGDVLLGLHVWPTTDLNTLDAILSREDLGQLSPLKFRVARGGQGTFGEAKRIVVTGRINVNQDPMSSRELTRPGDQHTQPESAGKELSTVVVPDGGTVLTSPSATAATTDAPDDWTQTLVLDPMTGQRRPAKEPWEAELEIAQRAADKNGKFILIYFYSTDSTACEEFEKQVLDDPESRAAIDRDYELIKIDVNKVPSLAANNRIKSIPAVTVISPNATTSFKCHDRDDFLQELKQVREKFGQPASNPLAPGDEVKLRVAGAFPEWPLDDVFRIEEEGTLALGPAYGRVAVAGQTVAEAEKTLKSHLAKMLTNVEVQLTLHQRAYKTYLYDGKPFDEWRSFWKHELNSERRIEAIEALVAFARAGRGREAVEAIFDVAGEYDFKYIDQTPEGKLQERVTKLLTLGSDSRIPAADWLPVLMDRLAKDPKKWRPLTEWLIGGFGLSPDTRLDPTTRKLLLQMAGDPKVAPNAFVLSTLYKHSPQAKGDPELAPLIKAALAGEDVGNALYMLSSVRFASLDAWPEQMELLFHKDAAVRRRARMMLSHTQFPTRRVVANRLTAILDDPKRANDHADAIRALGVLSRQVKLGMGGAVQNWPNEELNERFTKRFDKITREGPPELVAPALVAMGVDSVKNLDAWLKQDGTDESEMYKERLKQARDKIEAEADQVIDRPKPVDPSELDGGGMGGGGGGFF